MTPQEMEARIVRYGELQPCRTAFIDAHTPGSDQKENFTIIGGGVSESPTSTSISQFRMASTSGRPGSRRSAATPCIRTAPPRSSSYSRAAGGSSGAAGAMPGEVVHEKKAISSTSRPAFSAVLRISVTDYGMIMAILGGDDAGGGVIWAPQVIEDAKDHGLILAETGKLYDTKKGEQLPQGVNPMPKLTEEEANAFPEPTPMQVIGGYVRRYWDMVAISHRKPVKVIGQSGIIRDKPGFEVDFITRGSATEKMHQHDRPSVLMPVRSLACQLVGRFDRSRARRHDERAGKPPAQCGAVDDRRSQPLPHRGDGRSGRPDLEGRAHDEDRVTHVGSLPRTQKVVDFIFAREQGEPLRHSEFDAAMTEAVDETVRRQVEAGSISSPTAKPRRSPTRHMSRTATPVFPETANATRRRISNAFPPSSTGRQFGRHAEICTPDVHRRDRTERKR
jgi:hypothetical protein